MIVVFMDWQRWHSLSSQSAAMAAYLLSLSLLLSSLLSLLAAAASSSVVATTVLCYIVGNIMYDKVQKIMYCKKCTVQYLRSNKSTVHGNSILTDGRRRQRTTTHFKSFLLPDLFWRISDSKFPVDSQFLHTYWTNLLGRGHFRRIIKKGSQRNDRQINLDWAG